MMLDPLDATVTEALRAWLVQHDAGVSTQDALRTSAKVCGPARARACFEEAARRVDRGEEPERMLEALAPLLSEAERAVMVAGWKSGRVDGVMGAVVAQRELWTQARRQIRARLAMPALVLMAACFIAPLPNLIAGSSLVEYTFTAFTPILLAVFAYFAVDYFAHAKAARSLAAPSTLDRIWLALPILGGMERLRNGSQCASTLAMMIDAGVLLSEGLDLCARTLPNGAYRAELARFAAHIRKGEPLGTAVAAGSGDLWPMEFAAAVRTGEATGRLDDTLGRLGAQWREAYVQRVEMLAAWLPRFMYALVACFVIYNILKMAATVFGAYSNLQ